MTHRLLTALFLLVSLAGSLGAQSATAIQRQLDNAAKAGGGIVELPAGNIELGNDGLTIGGFGVRLVGKGSGVGAFGGKGTVLHYSGDGYAVTLGENVNDVHYGLGVQELSIVGTGRGKAGLRIGAINEDPNTPIARLFIDDIAVMGFTSSTVTHEVAKQEYQTPVTGACGIFVHRGVNVTMTKVDCWNNYIGMLEASAHMATTYSIQDCYFHQSISHGVQLSDSVSFCFGPNAIFESNGGAGLLIEPHDGRYTCAFPSIDRCYFENNWTAKKDASKSFHIEISGQVGHVLAEHLNMNSSNNACGGISLRGVSNFRLQDCILANQDLVAVHTDNQAFGIVEGPPASKGISQIDYPQGEYRLGRRTTFASYLDGKQVAVTGLRLPNGQALQSVGADRVPFDMLRADSGDNVFLDAPAVHSDIYLRAGGKKRMRLQNGRTEVKGKIVEE